jgi:hypothetical protein
MSVDALVVTTDGAGPLGGGFTELARQQLGPGRSYLVQAKGEVGGELSETTVRLEVLGFGADEARVTLNTFQTPLPSSGHATFALTTAFTAPDDEEFVTAAIVSASRTGLLSIVRRVTLLVLTVDSLSIQTG